LLPYLGQALQPTHIRNQQHPRKRLAQHLKDQTTSYHAMVGSAERALFCVVCSLAQAVGSFQQLGDFLALERFDS
jgi:hypothetical protein